MDPSPLSATTAVLGITTSIFMSGTYFSASQLTLPILYRFPPQTQTSIFAELYWRGLPPIVGLAAASAITNGISAYSSGSSNTTTTTTTAKDGVAVKRTNIKRRNGYIVAAVLGFSSIIFTRLVMKSTIDQLLELEVSTVITGGRGDEEKVLELLKAWRFMNYLRAGMGMAGGLVGGATLFGVELF